MYNRKQSLTAASFWKTGIGLGILHGAAVFFLIYYSEVAAGRNSIADLYSMGKIAFVALIGVVDLEIALITRFWTWIYATVWIVMFILVSRNHRCDWNLHVRNAVIVFSKRI